MQWIIVALSSLCLALGGATFVQTKRLDHCQLSAATYRGGVEALGHAAEEVTKATDATNEKRKERADEKGKVAVAAVATGAKRVRDDVASRGVVPEAPAPAPGPDVACYARADLDGVLRGFVGEVADLVARGGKAEAELNVAKEWAQNGD